MHFHKLKLVQKLTVELGQRAGKLDVKGADPGIPPGRILYDFSQDTARLMTRKFFRNRKNLPIENLDSKRLICSSLYLNLTEQRLFF